MKLVQHSLALALVCGAGTAAAQTATPAAAPAEAALAACLALTGDAERLNCYDRLHGRIPSPAPPPPDAPAPARRLSEVQSEGDSGTEETRRAFLGSSLSERWELDPEHALVNFLPRPYKPVYLLPLSWASRANLMPDSGSPGHQLSGPLDIDKAEAKFQLSLKSKLWTLPHDGGLSLWGAYTQSSRWQVYNGRGSRPFRETNYEPELILALRTDFEVLGWRARLASVSFNHQSNGRALPLSRSWNRIIGELSLERGESTLSLRPWWRIREGAATDDNPGVQDFVGRGELLMTQKLGRHVFSLQARHSLRGGERSRGSLQLEWAFPLGGGLHGYAQLFSGHGESLIDYNHRQTRLGLGISVVEWR